MSKNKRLAQQRAREIVARQRRAEVRRQRMFIAGVAVIVVLLALGGLVVFKLAARTSKSADAAPEDTGPAAATLVSAVTGVPASVLDQVGTGKVDTLPTMTTGRDVLSDGGKPLVVYMGAEYCPYCAAERWAMVVALSRFGTFADLGQTHSSTTDVYPDTATLSFHGSSYTSQYLSFQGVEMQSNQRSGNSYAALDTPTADQQQLLKTYDAPPYTAANSAGSIPFIDFGNQAVVSGASYSPKLLAGKTADQIAAALSDPGSDIARAVDGAANAFTTLICQLTKGQPGAVCTSKAATAYQGKFHAAS